jgi:putative ABC transport system permease protein
MDWMNMQWITAYWMPLAIAVVIGFILGWLLTGLSPRRLNKEYEAQIADLQSKSRRTERDLADARKQADGLKNEVSRAVNDGDSVRKQLGAVQEELKGAQEQGESVAADLQMRNIEVADAKMQLAMLQDQFDRAQSSAANEIEELRARYEAAVAENGQLREAYDAAQSGLATLEVEASASAESARAREVALNEAYQRAVNLQRLLEDREHLLVDTQAELESAKGTVEALSAANAELNDRLQKARGDVASEMAALTSTMIKMKDDALVTANSRIAELTKQVNELQSKQAVG